ncbi:MAG: RibD family protein [Pseudomonadota bacterium]
MHTEITSKVWDQLLSMRRGTLAKALNGFSPSEAAAWDLYSPLARRDTGPVTVAQIGQSLDGRVATTTGDAQDVSGPDGLAHLHRMRALVDGVIIGVRTAIHDAPQLTVRLCEGDNPARIVIDPSGRLPDDARLLRDDGTPRFVVQAVDRVRPAGVHVIRLPLKGALIDPVDIVAALRAEGLRTLLVEGGGITIAKFLEAGLLDRLQIAIAPLLIGDGPQSLTMPNASELLCNAIRPKMRAFALGSDVVFDCSLSPKGEARP